MTVTRLEIRSRTPLAGGETFGEAGTYERVDGLLHFAVDPNDPLNEGIVDLDKAARGADGRVHFSADFCLLQPQDGAKSNGRLLYEVSNRGRRGVLSRLNRPAPSRQQAEGGDEEAGGIGIGDGLLLRHGWSVAWCGWQWDVLRELRLLGFDAPPAVEDGRPIPGQVMLQFQIDAPMRHHLLADRIHHPYSAADIHDPDAMLTVQEWPDGPRETIAREHWRFAREEGGRPIADDSYVWLANGFEPGKIYTVLYRTRVCPVVGTGLLAVRDCLSFLRYGSEADGNPCSGRVAHTFGFGSSQSGRFLRTFLHLGLNVDERRRQVFDGLLINVAGARRGEFNHRYAQPSVIPAHSFGHLPPFAFDDQTDPFTGQADGLLRHQRSRGGVPKIMATNTAAEYWNRAASLIHTDPSGERDLDPPSDVRVYLFASTKHAPGTVPKGPSRYPSHLVNILDFTPLIRATFFNLVDWVIDGAEPPPSAFPRLADGTAAHPEEVLKAYHALPGVAVPELGRMWLSRGIDLGPEAPHGVGRFPAEVGEPYPFYVSALDGDGNEVAGIRLPDVAVPVATHTGWFSRRPETGGEGQNVDMTGSTIPFAPEAEQRQRSGDPRPAIAERYRDRGEYRDRVRAVAEDLVKQRYLLSEDVEIAAENALNRYDAFAGLVAEPERG
jgi:hypothetical protein